jgi:hypothetical protein
MEGSSQDDFKLDREPPGRNQETNEVSAAGPREGGTRSRGLTVRITEQPGHGRPIQPEGASTPLDEVRPTMLEALAASSVCPDYRRQLEMDTQDSEEDFFFHGSRRYPNRGAGAFSSPDRGAERPSGVFWSFGRDAAQPPRPLPQRLSQSEPPQQDRQKQRWDPPEQNQDQGRREEQSRQNQENQGRRGAEPSPNRDRRRSSGAGGGGGGYDSDSDDDLGYRPPNTSGSGCGSGCGSGGGSGKRGR